MNFSHKGRNVLATIIVLILAGASVTDAAMSYGVGTRGSKGVYEVDFDAGSVSPLFPTGDIGWYGATDGDNSDTFFATPYGGSLYRINPNAHVVTEVGPYGKDASGNPITITGLAYNEDNEILYATDYSKLYTIDTTTGTPALIGSFGGLCGPSQTWALDYDPSIGEDGELVGISQTYWGWGSILYHIDMDNGSASYVNYVHLESGKRVKRITDIWYDAESEKMFGIANDPFYSNIGRLYEINSETGVAFEIGDGDGFENIDLLGLGAPTIPEPATIILLGLGGMMFLRKRAA